MKINKKILISLLPTMLLVGSLASCNPTPTPDPEPEPTPVVESIDFDFSPTDDENITVDKGSIRQVQISFKKTEYYYNVGSIKWEIDKDSVDYISYNSKADDGVWYKFKADKITPDLNPAMLKVTVTNKKGTQSLSKTCHINIETPAEEQSLNHDGEYYSYQLSGTISKDKRYRFTATRDSTHNFTYFGMCDYNATEPPYFDVGYKNTNKTVNVTSVSIYNGSTTRQLVYGASGSELYSYSSAASGEILVVKTSLFKENYKIIIECTITKELSNGLWAYVGSY